ncbi:MAG: NAD(P)/FAD-dependent oxidoreductase [Candidatus Eremiobacteraeota bacterium]|nr:NAD(P)/FAD-dependent oxidoreductase [Candidatus Eremiobacteraeota bacterium]
MPYDAIVIGAGHNGLIAAAYLSKAGQKVLVVERSDVIGGAAVSEHPWAGWTVSAASYVVSLLHPDIVADLDLESHGYHAYLKDPTSFTATQDGQSLLLWRNPEETKKEIGKFSRSDFVGLQALDQTLCAYGREIYNSFFDEEPRFDRLSADAQAMFRGSAADFVEHYVETPMLAAAIANDGIVGTFEGPRNPGTGYVLAHHYAGRAMGIQGAWGYVRGGMGSISAAAAAAARGYGAEIRTAAGVGMILVDDSRAAGVVLEDGTEVESRYVLSNANPVSTFLEMIPAKTLDPAFVTRVHAWRCEGPSMKLNLALGELPNFSCRPSGESAPHHNATIHIAPDVDYLQHAYDEAKAGLPSSQPMVEMFLQTPSDLTLAPKGKHLLSIFAQYFPYTRKDGPWTDAQKDAAADTIIATIGKYAPNVPDAVEARQILTPVDLERRFGLPKGHIFHGELLPGQIFEDRFAVRTPLRGLYLCGSGTHPGGCVSGAPGVRGARAVLKDLAAVQAR